MHFRNIPMAACMTTSCLKRTETGSASSRNIMYHLSQPDNIVAVDQSVVQAICERQLVYCTNDGMGIDGTISLVEGLAISADTVPESVEQENESMGLPIVPHLLGTDLKDKQRTDQSIRHVISQIECGEKPPPAVRTELPDLPLLLRELNRLRLRDGILHKIRQEEGHSQYQLV